MVMLTYTDHVTTLLCITPNLPRVTVRVYLFLSGDPALFASAFLYFRPFILIISSHVNTDALV